MRRIGLTGSIAMGKSTTCAFFKNAGIPFHDADAAVHSLYNGLAIEPITKICPEAVENNAVNRQKLSEAIKNNQALLPQIEAIIHPLVLQDRIAFEKNNNDQPLILFDVPLLFETSAQKNVDFIVCVSASAKTQRARALSRPNMNEEKLNFILSKQMPDSQKRARSHFIINTENGLETAERQVNAFLKAIKGII
jgi:dephospho-CoA kinase